MQASLSELDRTSSLHHIAHVEASRPLNWLRWGWRNLRAHPGPSLAHGAILAVLGCLVLLLTSTHVELFAAAISGFLIVGPIFAAAFYELSRLRDAGLPVSFDASLEGALRNARLLIPLGLVLAALTIGWVWLSGVLFERAFGAELPSISDSAYQIISNGKYGGFFLTYMTTGAVLAVVAFTLSALAAPMIFDGADTKTAIATSIRAVIANPVAMAVWAIIIAVLTALGFATFMIGLVVVLPLLGHATWHAYRDLIHGGVGPWQDKDI